VIGRAAGPLSAALILGLAACSGSLFQSKGCAAHHLCAVARCRRGGRPYAGCPYAGCPYAGCPYAGCPHSRDLAS